MTQELEDSLFRFEGPRYHANVLMEKMGLLTEFQEDHTIVEKNTFKNIEDIIKEFTKSKLTIITGHKCCWEQDLILHMMLKINSPIVLFSPCLSAEEIYRRLFSILCHIELYKIHNSNMMDDDDWNKIYQVAEKLFEKILILNDANNITVENLQSMTNNIITCEEIGYIFINNLQGIWSFKKNLFQVCSEVKDLAEQVNIPIIAISEFYTFSEGSENKRAGFSSNYNIYDNFADTILYLKRKVLEDKGYEKRLLDPSVYELEITKNVHGKLGKLDLIYDPLFATFKEI